MKIHGLDATILKPKNDLGKLAILLPSFLDTKNYNHIKFLEKELNSIGYFTISFDPTGVWESDGTIEQYNMSQYLRDLENVIKFAKSKNKFDEIVLIGHSVGGQVAIFYASEHPEINTVISIMTVFEDSLVKNWKEDSLRYSKRDLPNDPKSFKDFAIPFTYKKDKLKYNLDEALKNYKNNILVISGNSDTKADPKNVKKVYDMANEPKKYININGISHDYRQNIQEVKAVNKKIIDYLYILNKVTIVDENDNIIGYKNRNLIRREDIYRANGLWITNSKNEILLAQRKFTKKNDPGKWGPAVAGTIEVEESYRKNIIKEAYEELGLKNIKPIKGSKYRRYGEHNYFVQRFCLKVNKKISEFRIAENEVEQIKWYNQDALLKLIKEKPEIFVKTLPDWINEFNNK
jgi:isopentenyldiphosphate isomerase/dienelactone hydrolase